MKAQRKRKVDERVAAKKAFQDKMATDEAAELKRGRNRMFRRGSSVVDEGRRADLVFSWYWRTED